MTNEQQVRWVCPNGHSEVDYTPLPPVAYCEECLTQFGISRCEHEWEDVSLQPTGSEPTG